MSAALRVPIVGREARVRRYWSANRSLGSREAAFRPGRTPPQQCCAAWRYRCPSADEAMVSHLASSATIAGQVAPQWRRTTTAIPVLRKRVPAAALTAGQRGTRPSESATLARQFVADWK